MVYFDIELYHRGYFGHVDGVMRYIGGVKLVIGDNDSDFWSVFEADEQVRRLGDDDVAALWYKDPSIHNMSIGLRMFLNDEDAIEMVRIAQLRGSVELFVVHDQDPEEGFPEIGYIDVGGDPAGKDKANVQNEEGVGEEAVPNGGNGEVGTANGEGECADEGGEGGDADGDGEAVGEDAAPIGENEVNEAVRANLETATANEEVWKTFDLDDNFFGEETGTGNKAADRKGKGVMNEEFNDDGEDNDEMEGGLYCVKMSGEETWKLRSAKRVGILKAK
ncbi:hypothetical protein PIB30_064297 [Stylosanthes scabra]|uniref:PB1-like domain-containing protein n=1 Tax=Stylosanthes scabra TaxID=79078 RepID=A0ABU6XJZ2_9FABA|nr:hypothetical protein [Stylosanthes scabra]